MDLSIIIPTFNEAETLPGTLESLKDTPAELILVDGGSDDNTVELARQYTSSVFISARGRGNQQKVGAYRAGGSTLVFLHADTRLPRGYPQLIHEVLVDPHIVFGAFHLSIHPSTPALKLIASMANLRSRLFRLPYGDQALFVRRKAYFQVGGFRDWPVMEDVDLVRRLNRVGRFKLARGAVTTSARRWQKERWIYTTTRNLCLMIRYASGISPYALARHYPDQR